MLSFLIVLVIAYLLGSLSSAIIVSKATGAPDPRNAGSGNAGATNVLRLSGKKLAIVVLVGDLLKGFVALLIARMFGIGGTALGLVGLGALLGHVYPLFFGFKGGKGVATAAGVMLALSPLLGICTAVVWIAVAGILRYSSLASITAAIAAPILCLFVATPAYMMPVAFMSLLILINHHANMSRLVEGKEPKIGKSS